MRGGGPEVPTEVRSSYSFGEEALRTLVVKFLAMSFAHGNHWSGVA